MDSPMVVVAVAGWCHMLYSAQHEANPNYVVAALPGMVVGMLIEATLFRNRAPEAGAAYRVRDTLHSIVAGLTQQLVGMLAGRTLLLSVENPHAWIQADGWPAWIALGLALDLTYYVMHRAAHVYQPLWVGHVVHHHSLHYNLSTAVRQSWWQGVCGIPVLVLWSLVASPARVAQLWQLDTLYQFWIHTCHVGRLPWPLEAVLMTPSHHRVHHDWRVHKNFGGVLIVWDRLLGTFLDEGPLRPTCAFGARGHAATGVPLSDAVPQLCEWRRKFWGPGPGGRGNTTVSRTLRATVCILPVEPEAFVGQHLVVLIAVVCAVAIMLFATAYTPLGLAMLAIGTATA